MNMKRIITPQAEVLLAQVLPSTLLIQRAVHLLAKSTLYFEGKNEELRQATAATDLTDVQKSVHFLGSKLMQVATSNIWGPDQRSLNPENYEWCRRESPQVCRGPSAAVTSMEMRATRIHKGLLENSDLGIKWRIHPHSLPVDQWVTHIAQQTNN